MARSKFARIQGEGQRNGLTPDDIPDGFISWEEHNMAWGEWSKRDRSGLSANEIEAMGGYSYRQVAELLGHNPVTWELREPLRYAQFLLGERDWPPDLTKPVVIPEQPPQRSHIQDGAYEKPICELPDDAPDGLFFFDSSEGGHCIKCEAKILYWLEWWINFGKEKTGA